MSEEKDKQVINSNPPFFNEFVKAVSSSMILTELEEWVEDMITPKPVQGGGMGFVTSINPELVLDKIQELKEKYK